MFTLNETMLEEVAGGAIVIAKLKLNIGNFANNTQVNNSTVNNTNFGAGLFVLGSNATLVQQANNVGNS